MGLGMIALVLFIPAIVVAVILAFWFAISAARAGHTLTTIASLAGLLMIASPLFFALFATRPQEGDENPIFLIQHGIFPSAVLAVVALGAGLVLRRRYRLTTAPMLLLLALSSLRTLDGAGATEAPEAMLWLGMIGLLALAAYPVLWVLAFRELSEYAAPRLAKLKQG